MTQTETPQPAAADNSPLTPAERANSEADARRAARLDQAGSTSPEAGGRGGLDPARFGDWEKGGIACDF